MQVFHVPPALDQLDSQPVQQRGEDRPSAVVPEIKNGCDQRIAEMTHPDVVHTDPSGQRVAAIGDPPGQCQATSGAG